VEQNRTDIGVWWHRVCTWHARVCQASGAQNVSDASERDRTSVYHWLHELPSSTLAATCWWWSLEPQRRQRYSSQRGTSQRCARASRQTPRSVSAICAVVNAYGGSRSRWRWTHASRGWGQPKKSPKLSNMLTRCDDGRSELQGWKAVISHREGVPRTSSSVLSMLSFSWLADIQ